MQKKSFFPRLTNISKDFSMTPFLVILMILMNCGWINRIIAQRLKKNGERVAELKSSAYFCDVNQMQLL